MSSLLYILYCVLILILCMCAYVCVDRDVVPDLDTSLKGENLTHGVFSCKIQGVYYFTYHISAKELV